MKLTKLEDQPVVVVDLPASEKTDLRLALIDTNEHAPGFIDRYMKTRFELAEARSWVSDDACPACGASRVTKKGRPARYRHWGRYGSGGVDPTRNVCSVCHHPETLGELFARKYGRSENHLDAAMLPKLVQSDFFVVRFETKRALATTFRGAIESFEVGEFDPGEDFSAVVIRAFSRELAARALSDQDFDANWFTHVPVDEALRPLVKLLPRWNATDQHAYETAHLERRRVVEVEIEREVAAFRSERRRAAGLA